MLNGVPKGHQPEHSDSREFSPEVEPLSIDNIPPVEQSQPQWNEFITLADRLSPDPLAESLSPELAASLGQLESALQQEADTLHLEISHQWLHYQIITACVQASLLAKAIERMRDAIMFTHGLKDVRWEDLFLDLRDKLSEMIGEITPADYD